MAILGVAAICATIVIKAKHHGEDRTMGNKFNSSRLFVDYGLLNQVLTLAFNIPGCKSPFYMQTIEGE